MAELKSYNTNLASNIKSVNGNLFSNIKTLNGLTMPSLIAYTTWNPSDKSTYITLSNGNLTTTKTGPANFAGVRSIKGVSTGKWYWEVTSNTTARDMMVGIGNIYQSLDDLPQNINGHQIYSYNGTKFPGGIAYTSSFTESGTVIGVALDMDNKTIKFYKNGVDCGVAFTGLSGEQFAMTTPNNPGIIQTANFGATPFAYSVPSGFNAGLY